jgi:hypothetical protein
VKVPDYYLSSSDFSSDSEDEGEEVVSAVESDDKNLSVDSLNFMNPELMPTSL